MRRDAPRHTDPRRFSLERQKLFLSVQHPVRSRLNFVVVLQYATVALPCGGGGSCPSMGLRATPRLHGLFWRRCGCSHCTASRLSGRLRHDAAVRPPGHQCQRRVPAPGRDCSSSSAGEHMCLLCTSFAGSRADAAHLWRRRCRDCSRASNSPESSCNFLAFRMVVVRGSDSVMCGG